MKYVPFSRIDTAGPVMPEAIAFLLIICLLLVFGILIKCKNFSLSISEQYCPVLRVKGLMNKMFVAYYRLERDFTRKCINLLYFIESLFLSKCSI